jgi:outer membrane protein OmpA-like peptidoglycan-associated protein
MECARCVGNVCGRSPKGGFLIARFTGRPLCAMVLLGATAWGSMMATASADSLADRLHAVQSGEADSAGPKRPPLPQFKPVDAGTSKMVIPMVKDLLQVAAFADPGGDFEWYVSIEEITADAVKYHYKASDPAPHAGDGSKSHPHGNGCELIDDIRDLAKARSTRTWVCAAKVEHYPGSLTGSVSTEVLTKLRNGEAVEFYLPANPNAGLGETVNQIMQFEHGEKVEKSRFTTYAGLLSDKCILTRFGTTDVAVPVLVNGQPVQLPALRVRCTIQGVESSNLARFVDFYVLDQPSFPIFLVEDYPLISLRKVQTIKISFPEPLNTPATPVGGPATRSKMEQALADRQPVQVYGIYFDFNSADLRPESEPVLREIASIMQKNPDWKLSVAGHTDNIGGDKSNLSLSERRSAAVKDALTRRFKIAPDRLVTSGYGASSPIDTNETFEGRAKNRRVELRRQ